MKLKLPKVVKVLGKKYTVTVAEVLVKENGAEQLINKAMIYAGHHNSKDCTIVIDAEQGKEQAKDTLVHEMLHAYDYAMQLDLSELQVHRLAVAVTAMLADNPEVVKFLISK